MDWYFIGFGLCIIVLAYIIIRISNSSARQALTKARLDNLYLNMTSQLNSEFLMLYMKKYGTDVLKEASKNMDKTTKAIIDSYEKSFREIIKEQSKKTT